MRRIAIEWLLAVGYVAVAGAILVARANPATAYEVSIYTATPTATWAGIALGLAIAISAAMTCRGRYQAAAIGLGALSVTTIVSLPLIRNYRFSGMGDALSHLGWVRDLVAGDLLPYELFYPGLHSIATAFHFVGGVPIERATLLLVVILFVPFLVFVPLTVRELSGDGLAVGIAAILSWFILPINNVATHMGVHTNSNALFVVPAIIFALIAYLRRDTTLERLPLGFSPFGIVIVLTGIAVMFVHPQQMINVVVLFGAVAAVQYLARWRFEDHPMVHHPATYAYTVVLGAAVALWVVSNERFRNALSGLAHGVLTQDIGGGETVDQRDASLTEIGGSLGELFVKMFLEAAIVAFIVAVFLLVLWLGYTNLDLETKAFCTYLGVALFPLGAMFVVYFVGTDNMAFRQIGFIYVVGTIVAAVAIAQLTGGLARHIRPTGANTVVAIGLAACLVLGLITVFASPIIYQPTQHVSDQSMAGYEASYAYADDDYAHVGLGYDPYRFDHGINGIEEESVSSLPHESGEIDPEALNEGNYSGAYLGHDYYFIVTEFDETREVEIYRELHYTEDGIQGIEADPEVNKLVSNDDFRMYAVPGTGDGAAELD